MREPVLSVLRQLVNVVGVNQSNIYIGDPMKHIYKHLYDVWHGEFPNVHYLDNSGYTNLGRKSSFPARPPPSLIPITVPFSRPIPAMSP